jgi:transcriptional regulator with XRE-family HTH domain
MRTGPKRNIRTRLGQALEFRDVSGRELARRTGLPPGSVGRWVAGRDPMSPERAALIAAALDLRVEDIT